MNVGHLIIALRIAVPILLFGATVMILQVFTNLSWEACAILGLFAALLDVFVIAPYSDKKISDMVE